MMMKMKLITAVLLILGAVGTAPAADVINVDVKGYGDNTPYIGNGAYDVGQAVWTVYYGGWGMPVGSARSEGLPKAGDANYISSVYAAQVWIGDNGQLHSYEYGSGLMNDGFVADEGEEPNLAIFGEGAFQGVYDIYVYGSAAGDFTLTWYGIPTTQSVTGDANAGKFELGHNYVIFSNVDINSSNPADIYLTYTGTLNALQLVKKKTLPSIGNGSKIRAGDWDVAGDRNTRETESQRFGPDVYPDGNPADANIPYEPNRMAGYIDIPEFMAYDFTVSDANKGKYKITADINIGTDRYPCYALQIFVDDRFLGQVRYAKLSPQEGETNEVNVMLTAGNHTVKWLFPPAGIDSTGFAIEYLKFTKLGSLVINNCSDVALYGLLLPGDVTATDVNMTPNCVVNMYDLAATLDNWLKCNNPITGCP